MAEFNDMLFHGELRVKQETRIPYFLCELNVASAKRDRGWKWVSKAKWGRRKTDGLCFSIIQLQFVLKHPVFDVCSIFFEGRELDCPNRLVELTSIVECRLRTCHDLLSVFEWAVIVVWCREWTEQDLAQNLVVMYVIFYLTTRFGSSNCMCSFIRSSNSCSLVGWRKPCSLVVRWSNSDHSSSDEVTLITRRMK